jgi:hypothetical protein
MYLEKLENQIYKIHNLNHRRICTEKENILQIIRLVEDFLIKNNNKIIIAGSRALNFHLPDDKKILDYEKKLGTDYDVYSTTPQKHADEIMKIFKNNGFGSKDKYRKDTNTHMIYCEQIGILDIKYMPSEYFKISPFKINKINKLKYLNFNLLKSNMYLHIVHPFANYFRWYKMLFQYKNYENLSLQKNIKSNNRIKNSLVSDKHQLKFKKLKQKYLIGNKNVLICGNLLYNSYNKFNFSPNITYIDVVSYDIDIEIKKIVAVLNSKKIKIIKYNNFILEYPFYCVFYNNKPIIFLHNPQKCMTFVDKPENLYTSIYYLIIYYITTQYMNEIYGIFQDNSISQKCLNEIENACNLSHIFEEISCFGKQFTYNKNMISVKNTTNNTTKKFDIYKEVLDIQNYIL